MSTKTSLISHRFRLGLSFVALATAMPTMASTEQRSMALAESDSSGFVITITAVSVVFSALVLLAVIFSLIGRLMRKLEERKKAPSSAGQEHASLAKSSGRKPSSEELVAISLALGVFRGEPNAEIAIAIALALEAERVDQHDKESYRLTIRPRANTPWNARHQGMRSLPKTYF